MIWDFIVIGGGPAGYSAAQKAAQAGLQTLLIEKNHIGGVCLHEGCIPSKTLLYSAKIFDSAKNGTKYGVFIEKASLNQEIVVQRKNKVIKTLVTSIKSKLLTSGVTVVEGFAQIIGKSPQSFEVRVDNEVYSGKRLLIATGSTPVVPPIPGLAAGIEKGFVLTNREILNLTTVPASLIIIGGGVIGLEMASYFNSAGSKVTVVDILGHIAGDSDPDIAQFLQKALQKKGVVFKLSAQVTSIQDNSVSFTHNGETFSEPAEKVLLSVGRKPVIEGFGLENTGIFIEKGRIVTDEKGETRIPGIFAAGDVDGLSMLAHSAYREAEVVINNILGRPDKMSYTAIPNVIYTNPEVASVGLTETQARNQGLEYQTAKISMRYSGRFLAENEGEDGLCKLLVDQKEQRLLGVHLLGNYASEIIYGAGMMVENQIKLPDLNKIIFPHPTVSEIIREALYEI
jgi:dihydrolipoamide dehydrogenase